MEIPEDWICTICGAVKKLFVPYEQPAAADSRSQKSEV